MTSSVFLTLEDVLEIHTNQISLYGGSDGTRDEGLLMSALSQPESMFGGEFLHPSISEQAAAYLYHIVKNHPFIDGNKRTGLACALVFLEINGYELDSKLDDLDMESNQTHLEKVVIQAASSTLSKNDLTEFVTKHIRVSEKS